MSAPLLTASRHRIRLKIALQNYRRKGGPQMSENQYDAPAMEVVEFDKEDAICTSPGDTCSYDECTPGIGPDQSEWGGGC